MNRSKCLWAIVAAVLFAGISLAAPRHAPTSRPTTMEVLSRKSIFARDRVSRVPWTGTTSTLPTVSTFNASVPVLVGVMRDDLGIVAVVEVPELGKLVQYHVGEKLPGAIGSISNLTLDYMEIVANPGQLPQRILVGQNLQGGESALPATAATSATGATTQPVFEGEDLIARMRTRRQQELNQ